MKKIFATIFAISFAFGANAADLSATRVFQSTADNSVAAKARATADARRVLVVEILRKNSDASAEEIDVALEEFADSDATALVKSMNIENEKRSATSYSATFTINLDKQALSEWLQTNDLAESGRISAIPGWTNVSFSFSDSLKQWRWMNVKLRENGVQNRLGLQVVKINDGQVFAKIPQENYRNFTTALRNTGANVFSQGGTLRVSLPPESLQ